MTGAKSCAAASRIFLSSFDRITSRASRKFKRRFTTLFWRRWRALAMPNLELYGTASCPYTSEMREWLEWKGSEFTEFDVETDSQARARMRLLVEAPFTVPLL